MLHCCIVAFMLADAFFDSFVSLKGMPPFSHTQCLVCFSVAKTWVLWDSVGCKLGSSLKLRVPSSPKECIDRVRYVFGVAEINRKTLSSEGVCAG